MSNTKIVIVDANAKTLREVTRVLAQAGYEVTTATSGHEGEVRVAPTDHRLAEMKLHRLNRLYQVLSRTNETIVRAANESDLFPAVCRVAVEQAHFMMAAVVTFDMATGQVRPLAHFGAEHGYFSEVSIVVCDGALGQGTIGMSIKTGHHQFCNDIADDPRMVPWRAAAQRRGYRSTASFPISRNGALIGALVLFSREVNYFLPDEVQLLVSVAADISFALDSFHSAASLRVSQRQNELLLQSIGEGIHGIDRAGRITFENPAAIAVFGWTEGEMIGRAAHATIHHHRADGSEYPMEECQIHQTLRDGRTRKVKDEIFFRKDGSSFPVEYVCSPIRDEAGGVAGAVLVFRDVTEQRLAVEKLKQTQTRYRDQAILLSNAQRIGHMGSWRLDIGDERMVWSEATCALFGISPEEFAGTREHFYSFVLPEDRPRLSADYSRVVASGGLLDVESEFRIRRPNGSVRWMLVRGNAHVDADGSIGPRFGMYMDITDRKQAEERILRLNRVYALLSALNAELVRIPDQGHLFDTACRIAVDTGKMHAAWIGLVDADTGDVRVAAQAGNMRDYHKDVRISGAVGPLGGGPFGVAMREGRSVVCNDIESDPALAPWRESALKRGFKSAGVFPLKLNGRTFGGYVHYADVPNFFDAEEIRLLDELAANISFAVEYLEKEQRRQAAEAALRESEERLRAIYEQAAVGICLIALDHRFERVNRRFCEILGYDADDLLKFASSIDTTHPDDREADAQAVAKLFAGANSITLEKRYLKRDQQVVWVRLTLSVLRSPEGDPRTFIGVIEDISARQALEEQLRRSQRLESIGQLTGGIAHDFNNLLTIILGGAEMLTGEAAPGSQPRVIAEMIGSAAERGADLTRRLLAFARRQSLQPAAIDVNQLVLGLDNLQRRTLGENVEIEFVRAAGLWNAQVDPGQLESALLNLTINARDAMPDGGRLTIETANSWISQDYADQHVDVQPGQYVQLSVSDTGVGIAPKDLGRVFEPFYTTKEMGKGTGLGLAMVYGFIRQSGGHVDIYSESGHGTTVKMYLPRAHDKLGTATGHKRQLDISRGTETILLVEDDEMVRRLARDQLTSLGYEVIEAANGPQALELIRGTRTIDLLFTDVVMPGGMSGRQLSEEASKVRPALKVLYTSGYAENAIVHHGRLDPGVQLLGKPYRRTELAKKIRDVLA
jgi:PAS domain S-box-containing protein